MATPKKPSQRAVTSLSKKVTKGRRDSTRIVGGTAEDDAQLANVDLQNTLQKQQQTLQMLSNISKMQHDNAMTIIRKIGE